MPPRKHPDDPAVRLAQQAPAALRELLHAFNCFNLPVDALARTDPQVLHDGLVAVVLRLVVLLHAEARDLLPERTVTALHARLRHDREHAPATLAARHDAWPALLAHFRWIHRERRGRLFDPDTHPLLARRVADDAVLRVLDPLLVLDHKLVDHADLDLEHLGSVHEALMATTLARTHDPDAPLVLAPGDRRRRSGAHYTPRSLTAPVVRTTLRPVLAARREPLESLKICDLAMGSGAFLLEACRQLADAVDAPSPTDALRRVVRCIHGVDRDPMAVEVARLSLWLLTRATDQPFTFVDHQLKIGDSLVGATTPEIPPIFTDTPHPPFHWAHEFPEVFNDRGTNNNPGFDCIVGNPPFKGSVALSRTSTAEYTHLLRRLYPGTGGKTDLVAFFLRRAFDLLRRGGTLGLIATNTIRQGDTRQSGLLPVVRAGGTIYAATRRMKWPGDAAVTVAVVHIVKGIDNASRAPSVLDDREVPRISAYLLPFGPDETPAPLPQPCRALLGAKPGSPGFIIDDGGRAGTTNAEADALLAAEPAARAVILPYLAGEDLLVTPDPRPLRRIFDLTHHSDLTAARASSMTKTVEHLRRVLRPDSDDSNWHRLARPARELRAELARRRWSGYLCTPETSKWHIVVRLSGEVVPSNTVVVFTGDSFALFACLQSSIHELWCREFSSTLEDRLRYVASDCFNNYPFPDRCLDDPRLAAIGAAYHAHRARLLHDQQIGLTALYNRLHDPHDASHEVLHLRELHAALDRAVLDAHGWTDAPHTRVQEHRDDILARLLDRHTALRRAQQSSSS